MKTMTRTEARDELQRLGEINLGTTRIYRLLDQPYVLQTLVKVGLYGMRWERIGETWSQDDALESLYLREKI